MIKTVDTDIVVAAVALFSAFDLTELWIESRSGKNWVYYPVHAIYNSLGQEKYKELFFSCICWMQPNIVVLCKLQEKKCVAQMA